MSGRQADLGVAAWGRRTGGETDCYPYENVARTPMTVNQWKFAGCQLPVVPGGPTFPRRQKLKKIHVQNYLWEKTKKMALSKSLYDHLFWNGGQL